jgi:hypothetical protein
MAITQIDIVNYGLILAGEETINSMNDAVKGARLANQIYEMCTKQCFDIPYVNWNFATVRTTLSEHSDEPSSGYDHQYNYPSQCRRIIAMVDEDDDTLQYEWRRELYVDSSSKEYDVILTNEDTVRVKYIRYRDDPEKWPGWFATLVGTKIGLVLCEPLKASMRKVQQIREMAVEALQDALDGNGSENVDVSVDNERIGEGSNELVNAALAGYLGPDWSNWGRRRVAT